MTSINILKNIHSLCLKNISGHIPPIKTPLKPVAVMPKLQNSLTKDVVELSSPAARNINTQKQTATLTKTPAVIEKVTDSIQLANNPYNTVTIDNILKSNLLDNNEVQEIKCAVFALGDETPEFKEMLDSLIKQKRYQVNIMSQDETSVSNILWALMPIADSTGTINKNVVNSINQFAKNKFNLKEIDIFIDNMLNYQTDDIFKDMPELEPILGKLSQNINIADKDFLSCTYCILKNDSQFAKFFFDNPRFLKAYNSTGLKLPNEDIKLMMKNFSQTISDEESQALMLYKSESQKINTGELPQQSKTIKSYLDKQSLDESIKVIRGEDYGFVDSVKIGHETLGDILRANQNSSLEQLKKLIATKLSNYQIIQNRFMSTSLNPDIGESGKFGSKIIWNITLPPKTKAACIDMALPQNSLAGETEVLVQKNSQLFIQNLEFKNNKWYIDAIVVQ